MSQDQAVAMRARLDGLRLVLLGIVSAAEHDVDGDDPAVLGLWHDLGDERAQDVAAAALRIVADLVRQVGLVLGESPAATVERLALALASELSFPPDDESETP